MDVRVEAKQGHPALESCVLCVSACWSRLSTWVARSLRLSLHRLRLEAPQICPYRRAATKTKWGVQPTSTQKHFPVLTMRRGDRHRLSPLTPSAELHFCESASAMPSLTMFQSKKHALCDPIAPDSKTSHLRPEGHGRSFTLQLPAPRCRRSRRSPAIAQERRPSRCALSRRRSARRSKAQPACATAPRSGQLNRLHPELPAALSSLHRPPRAHETPNLAAQSSRQQLNRTV